MADHLKINEHLTKASHDEAIRETFIGQAHIAGTGPAGTTCRECTYWYVMRAVDLSKEKRPAHPGYFGPKHKAHPLEVKKARCNRPILNKAKKLIPHHAKSCRLFEPEEHPLPARKS